MKHLIRIILLFSSIFIVSAQDNEIDLGHIFTVISTENKVQQKYTAEEIQESKSITIQDFLRSKGFLVMDSGGSGTTSNLSISGYSGACIKVYVNGILANTETTGEFDFNSIDLNSIESITVSYVPDINQLQFSGAVVNIITKAHSTEHLKIDTTVKSYEDSPLDTFNTSLIYQNSFKGFAYKVDASVLNADNNYYQANNYILTNNYSRKAYLAINYEKPIDKNYKNILSGFSKLSYNRIKTFGSLSKYKNGLEDDFNIINDIYLKNNLNSDINFRYDINTQYNDVEYNSTGNYTETTNIFSFNPNLLCSIYDWNTFLCGNFDYSPVMKHYRFAPMIKTGYKYSNNYFIIYPKSGVLFSSQSGFEYLPQLDISFLKTGITLSGYREFNLPTFNQLYYNGSGGKGNSELKPEDGWCALISLKPTFYYGYPLYLQLKCSHYKNKIRWVILDSTLIPQNTNSANYYNLTAGSEINFSNFGYNLQFNYTKALLKTGKQIMLIPEITSNAAFYVKYKKTKTSLEAIYIGKRYSNNENTEDTALDPYLLLNASFNYEVSSFWSINLRADNILDYRVYYHDGYSIQSRNYTIGVRYEIN